jgi:prepilin-type processing-associated H-X9-DG protein
MLEQLLNGTPLGIPDYDRRIKSRAAQITNPAQAVSFIESSERTINSGVFGLNPRALAPYGDKWVDVPTDRHNQGAILAFVDGHADYHRWRVPKPQPFGDDAKMGGDLDDLRWLQDHQSAP